MFAALKLSCVSLALCAVLAPAAKADGFGISYFKKSKHGGVAVSYSNGPHYGPGYGHGYRTHRAPPCYVPGHYETVREKVWVPGCVERIWVDPVYTWRRDEWGRTYPVCVSGGHYETIERPGRYELRERRVWIEGGWR